MNLNLKIGLRTIKSTIAVAVCVLISYLINNRDLIFFGGVASVICMQHTSRDSLKMGMNRCIGTVFGGMLGFVTIILGTHVPKYSSGTDMIVIALAALVSIYFCNLLKMNEATSISCIVLLNVTANYDGNSMAHNALRYVFYRVLFTLIGVIVALIINRFIFPYKSEEVSN